MDKKQLRKLLKKERQNIPYEKKIIKDKEISNVIINSEHFKNAKQVLIFSNICNILFIGMVEVILGYDTMN
jgi:5-formyltetrahydrofolate cyclo-ligase